MYDKDCIGRDCGTRFIRSIGRVALFTMLSGNVYAAADRFPGAQMQLDGLVNAAVSFEAPVQEPIPDQAELVIPEGANLDVNAGGEIRQSKVINQDLASLDVVDTGASRQVQKQQPAAVMSADAEAVATPESEVNISTPGEADELNTAAAHEEDHQIKNYKVMLPMTDVAEKSEIAGAVNGPSEDASDGTASEEMIHLPYAVLLAILALISMIPVARRNG